MIPTTDFVRQKFIDFNALYFDNRLPKLPFCATKARTYMAQIACRRERSLLRGTRFTDFRFRFSTRFDLSETEIEDIILHEMIHYHILYNNIHDTSTHGRVFQQMMYDFNRRHNRHIRISYKLTEAQHENDQQVRRHLICISHFSDGRHGITIATQSRIFQLWNNLPQIPGIVSCEWYVSTDTFFNRYPRSLTPKIYRIKEEDLTTHLAGALPLEKYGNTIRVRK